MNKKDQKTGRVMSVVTLLGVIAAIICFPEQKKDQEFIKVKNGQPISTMKVSFRGTTLPDSMKLLERQNQKDTIVAIDDPRKSNILLIRK